MVIRLTELEWIISFKVKYVICFDIYLTSSPLQMGNGPGPGMMPVSSADGSMNNGGMAMTTRPAMPMGNMQPMRQQMMGMPNQPGNQVHSPCLLGLH